MGENTLCASGKEENMIEEITNNTTEEITKTANRLRELLLANPEVLSGTKWVLVVFTAILVVGLVVYFLCVCSDIQRDLEAAKVQKDTEKSKKEVEKDDKKKRKTKSKQRQSMRLNPAQLDN